MTVTLNTAFGQAWLIEPSLELQARYDDNYGLDTQDPDKGFASTLSGRAEVSRLTDIWKFRGYGQVDVIRYSDPDLQDKNDLLAGFANLYSTELDNWQINGSYRRDTLLRTVDVDIEPGGVTPVPSGEDLNVDRVSVRRDRFTLFPSWTRDLTERTQIGLSYFLSDVSYEKDERVDLSDYRVHTITGRIANDITETDTVSAILEAKKYRSPDADREYDSYSFSAGLDHAFSETISGGFRVGARQTSFETATSEGDESGFLGSIYGNKRVEQGSFGGRIERQLYPSGSSGLVQTDQILFQMNRELTPRLEFSLGARAYRTQAVGDSGSGDDRRYLAVQPTLRWSLTEWWAVDASYRYRREKRDESDGSETADSNAVFVSLSYTPRTSAAEY